VGGKADRYNEAVEKFPQQGNPSGTMTPLIRDKKTKRSMKGGLRDFEIVGNEEMQG